jgi:hypothetical protein
MSEMDYARYQLEVDHSSVMNQVRGLVFFRTDFEERHSADISDGVRPWRWLRKPQFLREVLFFPLVVVFVLFFQCVLIFFRRFVLPWTKNERLKRYARELRRAAKEWKKTERWLNRADVREVILRADVPDEEGEDPFFVAEKISRHLLTEKVLRDQRDEFDFVDFQKRIAMSALVLADIGFSEYRDFEDPKQRRKRSRREF